MAYIVGTQRYDEGDNPIDIMGAPMPGPKGKRPQQSSGQPSLGGLGSVAQPSYEAALAQRSKDLAGPGSASQQQESKYLQDSAARDRTPTTPQPPRQAIPTPTPAAADAPSMAPLATGGGAVTEASSAAPSGGLASSLQSLMGGSAEAAMPIAAPSPMRPDLGQRTPPSMQALFSGQRRIY